MTLVKYFRYPVDLAVSHPLSLEGEYCYYLELAQALDSSELRIVLWLLGSMDSWVDVFDESTFDRNSRIQTVVEIGPRLNFETTFSSTAVDIFRSCGISKIRRCERSRRFGVATQLCTKAIQEFAAPIHDRMTEMLYPQPLESFDTNVAAEQTFTVPVADNGIEALQSVNRQRGLAMDPQDLAYYYDLFSNQLRRDPTIVELSGLGILNSDHARHWTFSGEYRVDGQIVPESGFAIIKDAWMRNPGNATVAFGENASAIRGGIVRMLIPATPGQPSLTMVRKLDLDNTLKVETHNHPSFIEPFEGGATGAGGLLRDLFLILRGGWAGQTIAGYATGNPCIPMYVQPWERGGWINSPKGCSPLDILIRASDGVANFGNCIGIPLTSGFVRIAGLDLPDGYRGFFKPIVMAGGTGSVPAKHGERQALEPGMLVVVIGGPSYRVGVGGAPASSIDAGQNLAELDFASVQRGDPEMSRRNGNVIRTCVELQDKNLIVAGNDVGGGGLMTSLTELVARAGAVMYVDRIPIGDSTLSEEEKLINESQERYGVVIRKEDIRQFSAICDRENCPVSVVGEITGDGKLIWKDSRTEAVSVDLPLGKILTNLPRKQFKWKTVKPVLLPFELPESVTVREALVRVLRLATVASKEWVVYKGDRSVTGLVAQQQCVGPNQLPLADFAIKADSHFELTGEVHSIGEQPLAGLIKPAAMGRMVVAEALTNMAGAVITTLADVKASGNWMWPIKHEGEGPKFLETIQALREMMIELEVAVIGGKDSFSMAAQAIGPDKEVHTVKAPGTLIFTAIAPMPDITRKALPYFKQPGNELLYIDLGWGRYRLGGSALAQVFGQLGDD